MKGNKKLSHLIEEKGFLGWCNGNSDR